jgi:hypothetical protein
VPLQSGWSDLCLQMLERAVTTVDAHKTLPKCQSSGNRGALARPPSCPESIEATLRPPAVRASEGEAVIDGGLIAGFLAAAAARGGARLLDRTVDAALDRLAAVVASKLGPRPSADLARDPRNPNTLDAVSRAVQGEASRDPRFEHELARLQQQLDRPDVRYLVNQVQAGVNVQAFDHGRVHVGDYYEGDHHSNDYNPADELFIGRGVGRMIALLGLLVALAGFAGWAYFIFSGFGGEMRNPFDLELVPGVPFAPVAFGAFLVGGLVYGLGLTMSKAARKRQEEQQRRRGPGRGNRR